MNCSRRHSPIRFVVLFSILITYFTLNRTQTSERLTISFEDPDIPLYEIDEIIQTYLVKKPPKYITEYDRNMLGFIKTHKTASTTITNLFLRLSTEKKLKVAVPPYRHWELFSYPAVLSEENEQYSFTPDVLCHHVRFNRTALEIILNSNKPFVATNLREPAKAVISGFSFFKDFPYPKWFESKNLTESATQFAENPTEFYNPETPWHFRARNYQAFDLGLISDVYSESEHKVTADRVLELINFLEDNFNFVLITDQLNESILQLKHFLNLDSNMILHLPLKTIKDERKIHVDRATERRLNEWNKVDYVLWKYRVLNLVTSGQMFSMRAELRDHFINF